MYDHPEFVALRLRERIEVMTELARGLRPVSSATPPDRLILAARIAFLARPRRTSTLPIRPSLAASSRAVAPFVSRGGGARRDVSATVR